MKPIDISIVIPCYNEEENLKRGVLESMYSYLKNARFSWEVIVTDDGSIDESKNIVQSKIKKLPGFILLKNPHGGKPSTLLYGLKKAVGKYVLFCDMDQSTPLSELDKLLPLMHKGVGTVIGSRGILRKDNPWYRKIGAVVFINFRKALLLREIKDTQCGFKLFDGKVIREYFPQLEFFRRKVRTKGWMVTSYDVELLHIIKKRGYKIKEVKVSWNDKDKSKSKGSAVKKYFRESKEMALEILRVKLNDLRGYYNR